MAGMAGIIEDLLPQLAVGAILAFAGLVTLLEPGILVSTIQDMASGIRRFESALRAQRPDLIQPEKHIVGEKSVRDFVRLCGAIIFVAGLLLMPM